MAQTAPLYSSTSLSSRLAGAIDQLVEQADILSGYRIGKYLDRYSEPSPAVSFAGSAFGVEHALKGTASIHLTYAIRDVAVFTIEEARERLQAFIDGGFVPEGIADLIEYLNDRFLRIETHIGKDGGKVNYLVDLKSGGAVPAHQVDPRLSHKALLTTRLRESMRNQFGVSGPAQSSTSWQGMMFAMDDDENGMSYTVSGKDAYYGRVHAIASTDPVKNEEILRKAREAGIELVVPTRPGSRPDEMVAGMPILRKSQSLKAAEVNPEFSHETLSLAFGKSMFTAYEEMFERSADVEAPVRGTSAISVTDFYSRFRIDPQAQEPIVEVEQDADFGFGEPEEVRDFVIRRASSDELRLYVWDRTEDEQVAADPQSLPSGEYERETAYGILEGYTYVNESGKMIHLDLDRERVNLATNHRDEHLGVDYGSSPSRRLH
jgi:hypothetical protein